MTLLSAATAPSTSRRSARTSRSWSGRARRQAAGLPRHRGHLAEAAPGARRDRATTTRGTTPTSTAASTCSPRRRPTRTRARATRSPRSSAPPTAPRSSSPRTPPRRSTSSANVHRAAAGGEPRGCGPATRSSSPRWSTTPTSCRGSCSPSAPARRCAGSASPTTAGSTCPTSTRCITERTKVVSLVHVSNVLGTVNPVAEIVRRAHEVGALVVRRRVAGRAAHAGRRAGARRRLRRLHRPQDVRADRHRRALGPHASCSSAAAVPRRRRDDRDRHDDRLDVRRRRRTGSRPARPPIAQAVGLGAAVDYLTALGMDAVARARARSSPRYALDAAAAGRRRCGSSARPTAEAAAAAISFALDDMHPHDVGQVLDDARRRRPGRPPLRPAGLPALRRPGDHPRVVLPVHHDRRGRRAGRAASSDVSGSSGAVMKLESMYQEIILDHYRQPAPRACGSRTTPRCTTSTRPAATR